LLRQRKPEFAGHIESGWLIGAVELGAGDVMHPKPAATDDGEDLFNPDLIGVVDLESTVWP
jgi:hypothetical protein